MGLPRTLLPLLLLTAWAQAAPADVRASQITVRGKQLEAILELTLFPAGDPPRAVLMVIDPSPSLRSADLPGHLATVLRRRRARLDKLRLGIVLLGTSAKPLPPGSGALEILQALRDGLKSPKSEVRDVYAALRRHVSALKGEAGRREILLISLENGDTETRLEKTIHAMQRANVRVNVVAREAFLSDSYWISGSAYTVQPPKGADLAGPDGAFIDLPWGWLFQTARITELAPSGYAMYGLGRLAAATGGRVQIFYPRLGTHRCAIYSTCVFCSGDHVPPFETFRATRLAAIEPLLAPRKAVLKAAAGDAYYRAVLRAWKDASKAGLVRSRPSVRPAGGTLVPEKKPRAAVVPRWDGRSFKRHADSATKLAATADRIAAILRADLEKAKKTGGSDRYHSIAELTYVMLRLTRLNLLYCAAYNKEVAPVQMGKKRYRPPPPERAILPEGFRITGLGYWTMSLCHGVAPFERLHLPGGAKTRKELAALDVDVKRFLRRNAYTPFAVALARMGIARFHPVGLGKSTPPPPREISGSESPTTSTRPERGGSTTSGGSSGPTSGG